MGFLGLMNFAALTLCVLVLATHNHQAQALRHGFFPDNPVDAPSPPPSAGLCASMISIHGYKCIEHEVTTKDGFILGVQRITQGRSEADGNQTKKEPVVVQHGVMVDGATWFLNSPEQNLPMILADSGFDVWVSNARGTKYSRKHTTLSPSDKEYWAWSWDELVTYEMPAIIDYVTKQTGQKTHYVGHSLGTLVALMSMAEGKWVGQVKSIALLSPIAYLSHMKTVLGDAAARSLLGESLTFIGMAEFNPADPRVMNFIKRFCSKPGVDCNDLFTSLTGPNCCLDPKAFDEFIKVEPQSTSVRNAFHLAQTVRSGVLTKFDFERPDLNQQYYGQITPPTYDLSKIPNNFPFFMSYGGQDALSDNADVAHLLEYFKDHEKDKLSVQYIPNYAHADYMMAVNANELVYNNVTSFFKSHSGD